MDIPGMSNSKYMFIRLNKKSKIKELYTKISIEDYDKVSKYSWFNSRGYVVGYVDKKLTRLHHFIIGKPDKNMNTDHINNDRLDTPKQKHFATP
jgi:hypothetical protein